MNKLLYTKFGTAKVGNAGYYQIISHKEGNNGKRLHRLIFADYWQIDDIDDFFGEKMDIHHIDGNKLNNELNNLEPIPHAEHVAMHNIGKKLSKETKQKIRKKNAGENNPRTKYGKLWDINSVGYNKRYMFKHDTDGLRPKKCFKLKYKGHDVPMGMFHDFTSIEIINELIKKEGLI